MAELIDKSALLEQYGLKDATKYGNKDVEQQAHSYSTLMLYEIADMIDDMPTTTEAVIIEKFAEKLGEEFAEKCGEIKVDGITYDILTLDSVIEIMWDLAGQLKEE